MALNYHPFLRLMRMFGYGSGRQQQVRAGPRDLQPELMKTGEAFNNWFQQQTDVPATRFQRYREMDALDADDILSSALDLLAEDATRKDVCSKRIIWASSSNKKIEKLANAVLRETRQEARAYEQVRACTKYGDHFEIVRLEMGDGDLPCRVRDTRAMYPYYVSISQDDLGRLSGYNIGWEGGDESLPGNAPNKPNTVTLLHPWEMLHFRLGGSDLGSPYGSPYLLRAKRIARMLMMMEQQLVTFRLMRSPDRLKWKVWTSDLPPDEISELLNMFKQSVTQKALFDPETGTAKHEMAPWDLMTDIYIPQSDVNKTDVEVMTGSGVIGNILDVDYFRKRLFAAIRIPPDYMGYEDSKGTLNANTPLAEQQDRYANSVARIQQSYLQTVLTLVKIDMVLRGVDISRQENEFRIVMPPVSYLGEQRSAEAAKTRAEIVSTLLNLGKDLGLDARAWSSYVGKLSGFPEEIANIFGGDDTTTEGQQLAIVAGTPQKADKVRAVLEGVVRSVARYTEISSRDPAFPAPFDMPRQAKMLAEAKKRYKTLSERDDQ